MDHVRAKSPYNNEEPLDGESVIEATEELLKGDEYSCLSEEFKEETK